MGGAPEIPQRNLTNELGPLFGQFKKTDLPVFNNQWFNKQPLLDQSRIAALSGLGDVTDLQNQFKGFVSELGGYQGNLGDLLGQVKGYQGDLGGYKKPYQDVVDYLNPILQSGGALTPEQARNVDQQTRAAFAARGNVVGNQALGGELLNRDAARQSRYNQALTQSEGATGLLSTLTGQQGGLSGLLSQIIGQQAGITGMKGSLTGALQDVTGKAINPALQTEQTATGTFATLLNPLLSYGSDLFSSNQNASAAQNIAGGNKSSGLIGGGIGAIGSILGAVL